MAREGLQVRMFSAYSMIFNGKPVNIMRGSGTKVMQLFAMLLLAGENGVAKRSLISHIYGQGRERCADPNRNLNNLIYRLKKQLVLWGMEGAAVYLAGGTARLKTDFPVEIDVLMFEQKVAEALAAEGPARIGLLADAAGLYTGEFLEEFCTELWVIQKDQELKKQYFHVIERLGEAYRTRGSLLKARDIYHKASLFFPFEFWQLKEMDCLIAMKDYDGAYAVYKDAERLYDEELGIMPGDEYRERLAVIENNSLHPARRLSDIVDSLREEQSEEAYFCFYPVFTDFCRILSRIAERIGQPACLLLCTWSARPGRIQASSGRKHTEQQQMEILGDVIADVFRKGGVFTRFSSCQYLILLSGSGREDGVRACDCLYRAWKKRPDAAGDLSYSLDLLPGSRKAGKNP